MSYIAVIYDCKYGGSKTYAKWIADELKADLISKSKVNLHLISSYEIIIFGGEIFLGDISGIDIIVDNFYNIKDKEIIVFTCGHSEPYVNKEDIVNNFKNKVKEEIFKGVKLYNFRSSINYKTLSFLDSLMLNRKYKKVLNKKNLNSEEKFLIENYNKEFDFNNKDSIKELIQYVEEIKVIVEKKLEDQM